MNLEWLSRAANRDCGQPTVCAYEVYRCGWMALCTEHSKPHKEYAKPIHELLARGEQLKDQTP